MKTDLIGVWSAYALFGPGAMEDQILVFRSDGTGWYNWSGLGFSNVKMFDWEVQETSQLRLLIRRRLRQDDDDSRKWIELEQELTETLLPFEIAERETPVYGVLPLLKISYGFQIFDGYGLVNPNADALKIPSATT